VFRHYLPVEPADFLGVWVGGHDERAAATAREAGARYATVELSWAAVEPLRGERDWAPLKHRIAELRREGLVPMVQIRDNPAWAADTPCGPLNEANKADFRAFMLDAVAQLKPWPYHVAWWEFYNEPDNLSSAPGEGGQGGGCWAAFPDGAAEYAAILQTAYEVLHSEEDPAYAGEALAIFGGLAYETDRDRFDLNFAGKVFDAGGAEYVDVINIHYRSSFEKPNHPAGYVQPWDSLAHKIDLFRQRQLIPHVKGFMPVMVSAVGWTHSDDQAEQAKYVAKVLVKGMSAGAWNLTWFSLDEDDPTRGYALAEANLAPRPAYHAYRTFAREFGRDATIPRPLTSLELGAGGAEGYEARIDQRQRRWVLWATGEDVPISIPLAVTSAFDHLGNPIPLAGSRPYTLTQSPLYLRY
jgi:hypothetical protein